jgi:hypothetical protein
MIPARIIRSSYHQHQHHQHHLDAQGEEAALLHTGISLYLLLGRFLGRRR